MVLSDFFWLLHIYFSLSTIFFMLTFYLHFFIFRRSYVLNKKLCCVNKKIFDKKNMLRTKIHKKYSQKVTKNILWQQNKLWDTQKRGSCRVNMFWVARNGHACWQKIAPVVHNYMLYWLKKSCVARKIFDVIQKLKLLGINDINFWRNVAPYYWKKILYSGIS